MITEQKLEELVEQNWKGKDEWKPMVVRTLSRVNDYEVSEEEFIEMIKSINFFYQPTTATDDDEYFGVKNPFDRMWYIFSSFPGSQWSRKPDRITGILPDQFRK